MTAWERLAEARMQEWLRRPDKDRSPATASLDTVSPLELQLLEEIQALLKSASACKDDQESTRLLSRADALQTRLLVVLEDSGRPLAAQYFSNLLAETRPKR